MTEVISLASKVGLKVDHFDEEFVPPDDSIPPRVRVRVIVNGLVAAKVTVPYGYWASQPSTAVEAETVATRRAMTLAERRIEKWRKAVILWQAVDRD